MDEEKSTQQTQSPASAGQDVIAGEVEGMVNPEAKLTETSQSTAMSYVFPEEERHVTVVQEEEECTCVISQIESIPWSMDEDDDEEEESANTGVKKRGWIPKFSKKKK